MESTRQPRHGKTPPTSLADSPLWFALLIAVVLAQGWLTLGLFGPDQPWQRLLDDRPLVSGRHPLHLYHGTLGASSLLDHGSLCCYDPAFQAGYPKTPVFDSGSRPAELFFLVTGGNYRPAAYKVGIAVMCLLAPLVVAVSGLAAGLSRASAAVAAALSLLVWWGEPCRGAIESGQLELLLASLAALAQVGLLIRFDQAPGPLTWIGILVSGYLGWFAHPVFFALGLPLAMIYYLTVGPRHQLLWHVALLAGLAGALLSNGFWLAEWLRSWWIQATPSEAQSLMTRGWQSLWDNALWGPAADRALAVALGVLGLVGVGVFNRDRQRATARLLGLGATGFVVLALAGTVWPPLENFGTATLSVPALLFAIIPAVHALHGATRLLARWAGTWRTLLVVTAVLAAAAAACYWLWPTCPERFTCSRPLEIGLSDERLAVAETLRQRTTSEARILWEDLSAESSSPGRWTALLPLLTERTYLGGLDTEARIEHAYASFTDGILADRPVAEWSNEALAEFSRKYNVGWVVSRSPAGIKRMRAWKGAVDEGDLAGGRLFRLDRPRSFTLKGRARWLSASSQRIVLADVVPENGEVILSLHYHEGLRASPGRVEVDRAEAADDPITFVRLKLTAPAARVTLTWRQ